MLAFGFRMLIHIKDLLSKNFGHGTDGSDVMDSVACLEKSAPIHGSLINSQ